MAIDYFKDQSIKYINRDFSSIKKDLIKFSQAHHSGVFQDFNETSPGMAILEMCAYVGDILSFYQDQAFNELKMETARQVENVSAFAKSLGYKPKGKRSAQGMQTFLIEVPSTNNGKTIVPDEDYAPILRKGARVIGPNGTTFETLDDIDFSVSNVDRPRAITGSRFDDATGEITHFALQKSVEIIAGETKTSTFTINDFEQFLTIELPNEDVIEVISVEDSDGEIWYEVDYLAQELVYDYATNENADSLYVPYSLKLKAVPRRFITDTNLLTRKTSLIFGSGDGVNFDDELIPNLADMSLPLAGRRTFTSYAIDPQNFLKTMTLGMSPFNTTLTVTYRVGGGLVTNVPAGSIDVVKEATLDFSVDGLDADKKSQVVSSIETINTSKTEGGNEQETISEMKANSAAYFAAQNRCVTREDYIARVMSIPSKFGKPEKVFIKRNMFNDNTVDIHILTKDENGHLIKPTSTLMQNVKSYLSAYRTLTSGINITPSEIINILVEFGVVVSPKFNRTEVMVKCLDVVRDYLNIDNFQIGSPIILSDIHAEIQKVYGVISVYELQIKNAIGSGYSNSSFDVKTWTQNNILYCPENSIFEVKYPIKDIIGKSK